MSDQNNKLATSQNVNVFSNSIPSIFNLLLIISKYNFVETCHMNIFHACLILTNCSSHKDYDSSNSSGMTFTSHDIRLTIGMIGSSGGCGTFR